ncbi:MAG: class I SAM-dependent rRNA methyltransferase [Streptococcaceae bacterium]|jgi:23S rRNA (cytosine1962-C5)-methyltransferase|nr:class I SAM-dependent rRNA methyltransferase [Streptococcaceae bacterium]
MNVKVNKKAAQKIKNGYPLLVEQDLIGKFPDNTLVTLVNEANQPLATAYLSKQNKGIGWVLTTKNEKIDQMFYANQLQKAKNKRANYFADETTNAFRVLNGEGDYLPGLTIDYYNGYAVFSWYNDFILSQKALILQAFLQVYPDILGVYEKIRFKSDIANYESAHIHGNKASEPWIVKENGVNYATYLDEGLMTGIFLDQKNVRGALVDGLAVGKSVLNTFSYTGAFSVAAAFGGALETTSVDLANRSIDKTKEQFLVNGLDVDAQKIYAMDVFNYFNYAKKKELSYDLIVLDPPSFARNKKKIFTVEKNYGELIEASVDILNDQGTIIASTNAANLSTKKFKAIVTESLKNKKVQFAIERQEQLPADFRVAPEFLEGDYLKVLFIKVKK